MFEHFTLPTGIHTRTWINGKPCSIVVPVPDGVEGADAWARVMGIGSLQAAMKTGWVQVNPTDFLCVYCDTLVKTEDIDFDPSKSCPCRTAPDDITTAVDSLSATGSAASSAPATPDLPHE